MPVETATYLTQLNAGYPASSDPLGQGDSHLRLIKSAVKATFPNFTDAPLTSTQAALDGSVTTLAALLVGNNLIVPAATSGTHTGGAVNLKGQGAEADFTLFSSNNTLAFLKGVSGTNTQVGSLDASGNLSVIGTLRCTGGNVYSGTTPLSPIGTVVMWWGSSGSIPSGWHICDGTAGTPNLIDRFPVGAGNAYGLGAQGGENAHVLSPGEMPAHYHNVNDAAHTHGLIDPGHAHNISDPGHAHGVPGGAFVNNGGGTTYNNAGANIGQVSNLTNTAATGIVVAAGVTGASVAAATTGISTTQYTGGNGSHENRPPYTALYFIMRIA